ncbi:translation initiation factor 2 [Streptomyces hygroscopicus]|uniref:translation initiation factor 2 n=1 Tax=Streptomyces TaxID=1883 RepID=UPI00209F3CA2|nr:translation initiation factor 2 [Streptomyces sp. RKCA744]MCO8304324.1 translation initiation factor 2 [Streptomyces sp. RKCA744]
MAQRDKFVVGPRTTDCHVFEGDGTRAILEENVHILYERGRRRVELPAVVRRWREETAEREARKEAAGLPHRWNNPRFAVESVEVARTHEREEPVVRMRLCDADYFDFLATSLNLDRPLREGSAETLRTQYLENTDPVTVEPFLSCSFGVNIAVETEPDRKMVFSRRSAQVSGRYTDHWNSSANEGLASIHDAPRDGSRISLHAVARRALREELAIQADDAVELELLAFALDLRNHQWAAFFRAVLRDLTAEDLLTRRSRGVEDKWEHTGHAYVPADPDSVLDFILGRPEEEWTPCAPALFYLALVRGAVIARGGNPSGRLDVEAAERRALARLAPAPNP